MRLLLIDNSNSRTKFAIGTDAGLDGGWRAMLVTADVDATSLAGVLDGVAFDAAAVASVVPQKAACIRGFFDARGIPAHFVSAESPLGMAIDYPEPSQIGADRLANAVGVVARHGAPAIVIDFGTAVTFDVVSNKPAYCGGVIAPGLGAMSGYLSHRTALLPVVDLEEPPSAIGKSTAAAMRVGAVIGYRGLVREILNAVRAEMEGSPHIVATGGDAGLIARGLPDIETCDEDLTLDGIRRIASAVFFDRGRR